jgi:hypothetical protein
VPAFTADSDLAALRAHQAAQEEVVKAADALLALLEADPTTPHTAVDAARAAKAEAITAMGPVATTIAGLVQAAEGRQTAITKAKEALSTAQMAVSPITATSTVAELKTHHAAQVAVKEAADTLVEALEAEPTSEAADITAAMGVATTADTAAMMVMVRIVTADSVAVAMAITNTDAHTNATNYAKGGKRAPFHSATAANNYRVSISRKRANVGAAVGDAAVMVFAQGGTNADPAVPTSTSDDTPLDAGDAPPAISGWKGAAFTRGTAEDVVIYTDIKAPTLIPFFQIGTNGGRYAEGTDGFVDLDSDATTGPGGEEAYDHIEAPLDDTGNLNTSDAAAVLKHLRTTWASPKFAAFTPTSPDDTKELEYAATTTGNRIVVGESALAGYFGGAPGTFVCQTGTCTIHINPKGQVVEVSTGWAFVPDGGVLAKVDALDGDYLYFGSWLKTVANNDATSSYAFQAFSGGAMAFGDPDGDGVINGADGNGDPDNMSMVVGTAEYSGAAGGMYVKKVLDTDSSLLSATHGRFTADAALTASFGGSAVAVADQFTIKGTVSKFMDEAEHDLGWMVKLNTASFYVDTTAPADGTRDEYRNYFNGTTEGGATSAAGEWRGTLHGPSGTYDHDSDPDTAMIYRQPSGVAGEFSAHFGDGHAHGAFGATKP